ncbi:hypothetical protein Rhopal_000440-T1 [Rhodotorula paludigena]|uniref:Uncharacterized protein n=1 Tax=Rhodotorula paludigena TaxID=86838 RepID=A0AAV5GD20_9BASI|nr:hypothetical protein Rhopal_000440-T1 [Rhodotorula paludigena]
MAPRPSAPAQDAIVTSIKGSRLVPQDRLWIMQLFWEMFEPSEFYTVDSRALDVANFALAL